MASRSADVFPITTSSFRCRLRWSSSLRSRPAALKFLPPFDEEPLLLKSGRPLLLLDVVGLGWLGSDFRRCECAHPDELNDDALLASNSNANFFHIFAIMIPDLIIRK